MLALTSFSTASALVGAAVGYGLPLIVKSLVPRAISAAPSAEKNSVNTKQLESMVNSMFALTSQMDDQVGKHSQRVHEITNSIDDSESSSLLRAGQMLVAANEQLQRELDEARTEIQRQRDQVESTRQESMTDSLTSLSNRRGFDREINRYAGCRGNQTCTLVLIDIDHFKSFNDRYGHMVGDQVLRSFARTLSSTFRDKDFVARYGGEEFAVILPQTTVITAAIAAERVRTAIAGGSYRIGELTLSITASLGLAEAIEGELEKDWILRADAALYGAKHAGRNCCCLHDGSVVERLSPIATNESQGNSAPSPKTEDGVNRPHKSADPVFGPSAF